ncbi:hypothetical protein [Rhizobium sp. MHM7A]|uniref:hypothetical protein n=1 Tax=Rhizobium sp. MHM7A TaxID=2583233 RepID=UPI00110637B3|nr:hypothetical protein [Rhizobium sp. MHM7A]TLX17021.1 hypothetical protein FFR93_06820 [Rhizobium sp. MHM7A]
MRIELVTVLMVIGLLINPIQLHAQMSESRARELIEKDASPNAIDARAKVFRYHRELACKGLPRMEDYPEEKEFGNGSLLMMLISCDDPRAAVVKLFEENSYTREMLMGAWALSANSSKRGEIDLLADRFLRSYEIGNADGNDLKTAKMIIWNFSKRSELSRVKLNLTNSENTETETKKFIRAVVQEIPVY